MKIVEESSEIDPDRIEREDFERVRGTFLAAAVAAQIPRRLGKEADSKALAADKYLSKAVAHLYARLWQWIDDDCPVRGKADLRAWAEKAGTAERKTGATINWDEFLVRTVEVVRARITLVSSFSDRSWTARRVHLYKDEERNLRRISWNRKSPNP